MTVWSPWLTKNILNMVEHKCDLYKKSRTNSNFVNLYESFKNRLNNTIRRAKRNYYMIALEKCRSNIRGYWKLIYDLTMRDVRKQEIRSIIHEGVEVAEKRDILEHFNTLSARRVSRTHTRWCQALFPNASSRAS